VDARRDNATVSQCGSNICGLNICRNFSIWFEHMPQFLNVVRIPHTCGPRRPLGAPRVQHSSAIKLDAHKDISIPCLNSATVCQWGSPHAWSHAPPRGSKGRISCMRRANPETLAAGDDAAFRGEGRDTASNSRSSTKCLKRAGEPAAAGELPKTGLVGVAVAAPPPPSCTCNDHGKHYSPTEYLKIGTHQSNWILEQK
jgi:hypothetical protein